ncbi:CBS domain-containing protein [Thalassoroseus pseudoceratinae]|uniref:CBS domain-containing protein n=1 Tax=Thalassoroseus pseudoceratinae TaxID=2713176 RepID=UPI0036F2F296
MNYHPCTATCDMSLLKVVRMLLEHKISNGPVVHECNGGKQRVGFISEKDCLEHLSNDMFLGIPSQQ